MNKSVIISLILMVLIDILLLWWQVKKIESFAVIPETMANQQTQEMTKNISEEMGIDGNYTVSIVNDCPTFHARILMNDKRIQICNDTPIPIETILKHEFGHVKEPEWFKFLLGMATAINMSAGMLIFIKTKQPIIMAIYMLTLLPLSIYGTELYAFYYSDMQMFDTASKTILYSMIAMWCVYIIAILRKYSSDKNINSKQNEKENHYEREHPIAEHKIK